VAGRLRDISLSITCEDRVSPTSVWVFEGDNERLSVGYQDDGGQGPWPQGNGEQSLLAWLGWWPPAPVGRGARKASSNQIPVA